MAPENQDVLDAVKKEIKSFGENTKESFDEINKRFEEMKGDIDRVKNLEEPIIKEKLDNLSTAITKHQENLDEQKKATDTRIDAIEVAMQRTPQFMGNASEKEIEEAVQFSMNIASVNGKSMDALMSMHVDMDEYQKRAAEIYGNFQNYYSAYLRRGEGGPSLPAPILNADQIKLLHVGSDPDGGIFVPPAMSSRIVLFVRQMDPMRSLASIETIGTDRLEIKEDLDEAGAGWAGKDNNAGERVAGAETKTPQMNMVVIPVHIMEARPRATQILLDDANINIENWLANKVSRRFARLEAAAFITGDGVQQPRGILDYTSGTGFNQVEQTNMGHATQLTTDGFIDVKFSLLEEYQTNASWLMNRLTLRDAMKLKDGDGIYIWRPGLTADTPSILLGHNTYMGTTMPVVAANALSIAFADWREFYTIVDRQGIVVQRDPYTQKPLVEFYTRARVGGGVVNFQAGKIGKVAA